MEKTIYDIAKEDLEDIEDLPSASRQAALDFIKNNHIGTGFQKKSIDFIYYLYYTTTDQRRIPLARFKDMLPKGPFVYFSKDKLSISQEEFRRIEIEYEKKEFRKRKRKNQGKTKFI